MTKESGKDDVNTQILRALIAQGNHANPLGNLRETYEVAHKNYIDFLDSLPDIAKRLGLFEESTTPTSPVEVVPPSPAFVPPIEPTLSPVLREEVESPTFLPTELIPEILEQGMERWKCFGEIGTDYGKRWACIIEGASKRGFMVNYLQLREAVWGESSYPNFGIATSNLKKVRKIFMRGGYGGVLDGDEELTDETVFFIEGIAPKQTDTKQTDTLRVEIPVIEEPAVEIPPLPQAPPTFPEPAKPLFTESRLIDPPPKRNRSAVGRLVKRRRPTFAEPVDVIKDGVLIAQTRGSLMLELWERLPVVQEANLLGTEVGLISTAVASELNISRPNIYKFINQAKKLAEEKGFQLVARTIPGKGGAYSYGLVREENRVQTNPPKLEVYRTATPVMQSRSEVPTLVAVEPVAPTKPALSKVEIAPPDVKTRPIEQASFKVLQALFEPELSNDDLWSRYLMAKDISGEVSLQSVLKAMTDLYSRVRGGRATEIERAIQSQIMGVFRQNPTFRDPRELTKFIKGNVRDLEERFRSEKPSANGEDEGQEINEIPPVKPLSPDIPYRVAARLYDSGGVLVSDGIILPDNLLARIVESVKRDPDEKIDYGTLTKRRHISFQEIVNRITSGEQIYLGTISSLEKDAAELLNFIKGLRPEQITVMGNKLFPEPVETPARPDISFRPSAGINRPAVDAKANGHGNVILDMRQGVMDEIASISKLFAGIEITASSLLGAGIQRNVIETVIGKPLNGSDPILPLTTAARISYLNKHRELGPGALDMLKGMDLETLRK